ncbi:MAG TPA: TonB-dependent receptor [Vicinamibacterales bacterium]|nr:TonB-dependent receptor [Vicinamibacterales bacterium]
MSITRPSPILVLLIILLAAPRHAAAQDTGTISATVVDASGQVLPGAAVTLTNDATGASRTMVSNERGEFTFRAVQPGTYTVVVELSGFRRYERRSNVLNASGRLSLGEVTLDIGALAESVTVTAQGTVIEAKNSDYSGLLTSTQIAQIQTKGRDVVNLLRLLPGVHYENDIEAMGDSFGSQLPNIAGQRRTWNQVTVDGLNGNELSGTNRMNSSINLDAIAEVKVLLNSYKAEFGHTAGANIEIVTKSGSADYRGSGYWYGRRDAWNATPWENSRLGLPKPKQRYDTPGFNIGGPVPLPRQNEKTLFFFYSMEAPQVQKPGQVRLYRMPTALERRGDFSQTLDANGRLMFIRDPLSPLPCSVTTGGAGCFPGNVIPADRLDPNGLAILNYMPLPNVNCSGAGCGALSNFTRQETPENPRMNNLLRIDGRPSGSNSYWVSYRQFSSNQFGSEITAGPAKWGYFDGNYVSGDSGINGGWNHVFRSNSVNEFGAGIRRATEGFGVKNDSDYTRFTRSNVGFTAAQFNPQLNPNGYMPFIRFGLNTTGIDTPDWTYDSRVGSTAYDWLGSIRDNITWTHAAHTFKVGAHVEYMQNNEARGGNWAGDITFSNNTSNPLNANFAFANAILGVFSQYTETDKYRLTQNRQWWSEWYAQDTWQLNARTTFDYGARFLWYSPYYRPDGQIANFDPSLYDPALAPRLYVPAIVNGVRVAYDPATEQTLNSVFIGAYVPGTGKEDNGMVKETDAGVPNGFRRTFAPQVEPRVGMTYDLSGAGRTVVHTNVGYFHQARLGGGSLGNLAANPPFIHNPTVFYNTLSNLLVPGNSLANRPVTVEALDMQKYDTPGSINWSAGLRREIGWGTAVDITYSGYKSRDMEMYYDINLVPDGARFTDVHPENRDPTAAANATPTAAALPAEFLRPYRGYQNIRTRGNFADGDYQSLQVQVNRRYIRGVQFGAAYALQRARGVADDDVGGCCSYTFNRPFDFFYSELAQSNRNSLVLNYSWDLPGRHTGPMKLLLDGWQVSGENDFVSGDWANVAMTTTDNFDFTGGEAGNGACINGNEPCLHVVRPVLVGDPLAGGGDPQTGFFNTAAFARPARGDYGNAPRNVVRKPGVVNTNFAIFKNVALGGPRALQFRAEIYNLFNQVEFQDIDRTARFDSNGLQVNPNFGTAIGISNPTRPPRVIQLSARINF